MKKIIAIDVGVKGAIISYNPKLDSYLRYIVSFAKEKQKMFEFLKQIIRKDDIVLIGEAFGFKRTVKEHSKWYGIIELVAEINEAWVIYRNDNTARKKVFGKDKGKPFTHAYYKEETEDLSDCRCLIDAYLLS